MFKYMHGSNEVNYKKFVCSHCGKDETFGKIVCLSCIDKIREDKRGLYLAGLSGTQAAQIENKDKQIAELQEKVKDLEKANKSLRSKIEQRNIQIADIKNKLIKAQLFSPAP